MRIGELADRVGVSTRALRYHEEQLLLSPRRTSSGQRVYPEPAIEPCPASLDPAPDSAAGEGGRGGVSVRNVPPGAE